MFAAANGHQSVVEGLIKAGASLDKQNEVGVCSIESVKAGMYYGFVCVPRSIYRLSAVSLLFSCVQVT